MNDVSVVPTALKQLDDCRMAPASISVSVAENCAATIVEVVSSLAATYQSTLASGTLWWYVAGIDGKASIRYPNITLATYQTHHWAYWITFVMQIRQLREDYPCLREKDILLNGQEPESDTVSEKLLELSTRIFESIDYFLQNEMKLYGAFSAAFPFQTACHFLKTAGDGNKRVSCAYTRALEMVINKGFQDILANEENPFNYPQPTA